MMKCWADVEYFKRQEFECKCGCGFGSREDDLMPAGLILALDKIRLELQAPMRVNSGFRCYNHNVKVGGVKNSKHLAGRAADVSCNNYAKLVSIAEKHKSIFGLKIIRYDNDKFLHIEV